MRRFWHILSRAITRRRRRSSNDIYLDITRACTCVYIANTVGIINLQWRAEKVTVV